MENISIHLKQDKVLKGSDCMTDFIALWPSIWKDANWLLWTILCHTDRHLPFSSSQSQSQITLCLSKLQIKVEWSRRYYEHWWQWGQGWGWRHRLRRGGGHSHRKGESDVDPDEVEQLSMLLSYVQIMDFSLITHYFWSFKNKVVKDEDKDHEASLIEGTAF